jgi:hypothetical protein
MSILYRGAETFALNFCVQAAVPAADLVSCGRHARHYNQKKIGMIKIATMFTTFIMGLMAGPAVSL